MLKALEGNWWIVFFQVAIYLKIYFFILHEKTIQTWWGGSQGWWFFIWVWEGKMRNTTHRTGWTIHLPDRPWVGASILLSPVHPLFPYNWRRQVRQAHGHPLIFFMGLFLTTPVYVNLLSSGSPMHLIYFPLNISSCKVPTSMLYFHWQYRHFP